MKIKVLFFASCRDIAGCRDAEIEILEGTTVEAFKRDLLVQYPGLVIFSNVLSVAVNTEYAVDSTVLRAGDEVALIPPVSGGRGVQDY